MNNTTAVPDDAESAGASGYGKPLISIYGLWVLCFPNTSIWRRFTRLMVEFHHEYVSGNHLHVGVGTGTFLAKCPYPIAKPINALADPNENSLHATASRLERYRSRLPVANVLESVEIEEAEFETIGLNYLITGRRFVAKGIG